MTCKTTHTHSFTLTGLALPITGLRVHGVFVDTAQTLLT